MLQIKTVTSLVSKCQLGVICVWQDQYHNLASKEGKGGHDGKSQQYSHVCSCVVSPHPQHSNNFKHGVPGPPSDNVIMLEQYVSTRIRCNSVAYLSFEPTSVVACYMCMSATVPITVYFNIQWTNSHYS